MGIVGPIELWVRSTVEVENYVFVMFDCGI